MAEAQGDPATEDLLGDQRDGVAHCRVGRPLSLRQKLDPVRAKFLH